METAVAEIAGKGAANGVSWGASGGAARQH